MLPSIETSKMPTGSEASLASGTATWGNEVLGVVRVLLSVMALVDTTRLVGEAFAGCLAQEDDGCSEGEGSLDTRRHYESTWDACGTGSYATGKASAEVLRERVRTTTKTRATTRRSVETCGGQYWESEEPNEGTASSFQASMSIKECSHGATKAAQGDGDGDGDARRFVDGSVEQSSKLGLSRVSKAKEEDMCPVATTRVQMMASRWKAQRMEWLLTYGVGVGRRDGVDGGEGRTMRPEQYCASWKKIEMMEEGKPTCLSRGTCVQCYPDTDCAILSSPLRSIARPTTTFSVKRVPKFRSDFPVQREAQEVLMSPALWLCPGDQPAHADAKYPGIFCTEWSNACCRDHRRMNMANLCWMLFYRGGLVWMVCEGLNQLHDETPGSRARLLTSAQGQTIVSPAASSSRLSSHYMEPTGRGPSDLGNRARVLATATPDFLRQHLLAVVQALFLTFSCLSFDNARDSSDKLSSNVLADSTPSSLVFCSDNPFEHLSGPVAIEVTRKPIEASRILQRSVDFSLELAELPKRVAVNQENLTSAGEQHSSPLRLPVQSFVPVSRAFITLNARHRAIDTTMFSCCSLGLCSMLGARGNSDACFVASLWI
ncbi:hypothetical protein G7046_g5386 [Stylonectria norvegica]|nr:hypothetical protein G7046_g5386 [Stylonectria norvegica]